jgi:mRNA interferase RelE/StbE
VSYTIRFERTALKDLKKFPGNIVKSLWKELDALKSNPRPHGCKKLKGTDYLFRIRVGNYRIIYQVQETDLIVLVIRIGDRKNVYRGL